MIHVPIRPLPYTAAGIDTPVRVATICGESVPPWDVMAEGTDVQELRFANDTRTGARTWCGLEVWPDEAITLTALRVTTPWPEVVIDVCPACKAAVVESALKRPKVEVEVGGITLDGLSFETFK